MHRMLIIEASEDLRLALYEATHREYDIATCGDGEAGLALLQEQKPYILVLDLDLPLLDGLELLRRSDYLPPVILVLGRYISAYTAQSLRDMGVGHFLYNSTPVANIARHIAQLVKWRELPNPFDQDPQFVTAKHLQKLGIPVHLSGYQQLKVSIPLYAQDPSQNLQKEVYTDTARLLGYDSDRQIERSVRTAIKAAWDVRNCQIWEEYFPPNGQGETHCPESKEFIARLAEILSESMK